MIRISPSVLAADFSILGAEASRMETSGAEMLHLDVMDGMFVPNISFGAPVIRAIRKNASIEFDVHLMIEDPIRYIGDFKAAGADSITFHIEAAKEPQKVIDAIHEAGCKAAISVKPGTPIEVVYPYLESVEMVLIMTVEPGFGGQSYISEMTEKIRTLRKKCIECGLSTDIQVDGGITEKTAVEAAAAGANILVAGSAVFKSADAGKAISNLRTVAEQDYATKL